MSFYAFFVAYFSFLSILFILIVSFQQIQYAVIVWTDESKYIQPLHETWISDIAIWVWHEDYVDFTTQIWYNCNENYL